MKGKKILAAVLAAAMVLGSSMTAFAANPNVEFPTDTKGPYTGKDTQWNEGVGGSVEGEGGMAGSVDKNIFHVVLPTEDNDLLKSALAFQLDPQKLITDTNGEKLGDGTNFDSGKTLYFPNVGATTSAAIYWTDTSNHFTVTNKGSVEVDVSVDAELSNLKTDGTITVSDDETFADDTETSMYMAIITDDDADGTALVADKDGEKATASIDTATVGAVSASAFKVQITNGKYEYVLDETTNPTFDTFSFWLKGASNTNGDWDALAKEGKNPAPKLKLTWKVKPHSDSVLSSKTISGTSNAVIVNSGISVTKAALIKSGTTTEVALTIKTHYVFDSTTGRFAVDAAMLRNNVGGTIRVTLSNGTTEDITIQ